MVQQGRAPENCQNRYFDRISESEAGRSKFKEERDKLYLSQLRIDFGQFRPESNGILRLINKIRTARELCIKKTDSAKSYNMYGISHTNLLVVVRAGRAGRLNNEFFRSINGARNLVCY